MTKEEIYKHIEELTESEKAHVVAQLLNERATHQMVNVIISVPEGDYCVYPDKWFADVTSVFTHYAANPVVTMELDLNGKLPKPDPELDGLDYFADLDCDRDEYDSGDTDERDEDEEWFTPTPDTHIMKPCCRMNYCPYGVLADGLMMPNPKNVELRCNCGDYICPVFFLVNDSED